MKRNYYYWLIALLLLASLQLSGCAETPAAEAGGDEPAMVEHLDGDVEATRITLTEDAAQRIDVQTTAVSDVAGKKVIPYAAILYDTEGKTWTYTNPNPNIFVRTLVTVDHIDGDQVYLNDGPDVGTPVVSLGATELFGSESEFEEE